VHQIFGHDEKETSSDKKLLLLNT